ncbi:hypothetical protein D9M70_581260 [compost metagenome]
MDANGIALVLGADLLELLAELAIVERLARFGIDVQKRNQQQARLEIRSDDAADFA